MKITIPRDARIRKWSIRRVGLLVIAWLVVGLLAVACGGNSPPIAIATPSATVAAETAATPETAGVPTPQPDANATLSPEVDPSMAAYASCMRSNGVPEFPDPNSDGSISVSSTGGGLDPNSPRFQTANQSCRAFVPAQDDHGGGISEGIQQGLAFSACMREHGVVGFPDPEISGGNIRIIGGPSIDASTPQFQEALRACQPHLPGGGSAP